MRRSWLWLLLVPAMGCEIVEDGKDTGATDTGAETDTDTDADSDTDTDADADTDAGGPIACTTGSLFAGDPLYEEPTDRPNEGDPILGAVPLPYRNLVFTGDLMVTHSGSELWTTDLSEATPVLHRFSGRESEGQMLRTGACDQARYANLMGLALGPDGSLYLGDQTANAVLQITDPFGPSCSVHHFAGSNADIAELSPDTVPNQGEQNGPGLQASFRGVERLTVSDTGDVYVWDYGNTAIRKIAADADHTVSTLVSSIDGIVFDLKWLDGRLYLWGSGNDVFLTEVDPSDGTTRDILRGRSDLFDSSSPSNYPGGMVTDGEALIVYYNGQLFRVSLEGRIDLLAGTGAIIEFDSGYDPYVSHPAEELELASRSAAPVAGAHLWLGIDAADDLYVSTKVISPYIEKVECSR